MKQVLVKALMLVLLLGAAACEQRTDKTDGGGVLLSVSDFDGMPLGGSVNTIVSQGGVLQVDQITLENVPKDPSGVTSDLMNVEIQSYEVRFTRGDSGTRLPVPLVKGLFGVAPVGGTVQYDNLPLMDIDQFGNPPLSDLLLSNGGVDTETGGTRIVLNLQIRFFGRTLSGDRVETAPAFFTMTFTP